MRFWMVFLTGLLCLSLAGCSMVRLAYDNAPWLLMREADKRLDLTTEQEDRLQADFERYFLAHRGTRLPHVVQALKAARVRLATGLSEEDWNWVHSTFQALYKQTLNELIPVVAPYLTELNEDQLRHLDEHLDARNQAFRDEFIDADYETRYAARIEYLVDKLEPWVGELTEQQLDMVTRRRAEMPDSAALWLDYTARQQRSLIASIRGGETVESISEQLQKWIVERADGGPALLESREAWTRGIRRILKELERSLTEAQRRKLMDTLLDYATALSAV